MNLLFWESTLFILFTILLVLISRRVQWMPKSFVYSFRVTAPVVWNWAALFFLSVAFMVLSGYKIEIWDVIYAVSGVALVTLPLTLLPVQVRKWGVVFFALFFSFIIFADLLYMRYFGSIVPFWALAEMPQVLYLWNSINALISPKDVWLLFVPFAALLFTIGYRPAVKVQRPDRLFCLGVHGLIFITWVLASLPTAVVLNADMHKPRCRCPYVSYIEAHGVINTHIFDLLQTIREYRLLTRLTPEDRQKVMSFFAGRVPKNLANGEMYGCAHGRNLIFIQVESFQQWVVNKRINGQEITPFLNRLSKEALYYPYIFDQTADGRSSDTTFTALNSLYSLERGAVAYRRCQNHFVALPWLLKRAGYATFAAEAVPTSFWNASILYQRYGFERRLFSSELRGVEQIHGCLSDRALFKRMIPELVKLPRPFFAFLVTLSSHHPFKLLPARYKVLHLGNLEDTMLGDYIHFMHYVDTCLEQFFHDLEKVGLLDKTVVAIYGDHDAGLPINNELLRFVEYDRQNSSVQVWIDRIPFFVVVPGINQQGEMPVVGGHVNIAPTVLYFLGVEQPRHFIGKPLLPDETHNIVVLPRPWSSAVTQDRMFVSSAAGISPKGECFEFPSGDPLPVKSCEDLAQRAHEELEISQLVVLHDLAREIAGFDN